ncbi:MAG: sugar ABC transporter substrate-binding protein [Bowdeniella nasicola]|nr:sugar ABC transporter substrate-binding protein [Bowdeniella nasicola]
MRRSRVVAAATAALMVGLAACSPGASESSENTTEDSTGATTVTFRLWDENAAKAYQESFDAFTSHNPDIKVDVEVIPWGQYWDQLPLDLQSGDMADIFWTNSSNFGLYADNGNLIDISEALGHDHDAWVDSTAELYERDGKLWGVPQIWDSIALYYNKDLVEEAGVDPSDLTWAPGAGDGDTLLAAATKLTKDEAGKHPGEDGFDPDKRVQYGFNSQVDLQAIYIDWLAEGGASFQAEDSDDFVFASPEGEAAFQYLVDMVNTAHVSPSAADTNQNGDLARELFLQGKMALFQSGPYSLPQIAENADFEWGIAPMVAGPEGRVSVVHSVAALGNAESEHYDATVKVLKWLASKDGQTALAATGAAFPAVLDAQDEYVSYWEAKGVDVSEFQKAAEGATTPAPVGADVNAGMTAFEDTLKEMFLGAIPVPEALKQAQEEGNAAMR